MDGSAVKGYLLPKNQVWLLPVTSKLATNSSSKRPDNLF